MSSPFLLPFGIKSATLSYLITSFNAPHRTVLADFPHTALQSISSRGQRLVKIMHYSRTGKRVICTVLAHLFPRKVPVLPATIQPLLQYPEADISKLRYHPRIAAYAVVVVNAPATWPNIAAIPGGYSPHYGPVSASYSSVCRLCGTSCERSYGLTGTCLYGSNRNSG